MHARCSEILEKKTLAKIKASVQLENRWPSVVAMITRLS